MNKLKSIIPDILFFRFSNDLWHILRAHGFGVAIQNGCSAIISVDESIICTMDVLGRITPDKTFRKETPEALNRYMDRLIYLYLNTLHTCLVRLPMIRLCIPVEEDTIDLLGMMIKSYCLSKDEADPDAALEPSEEELSQEDYLHCSRFRFLPQEDEAAKEEECEEKSQSALDATEHNHSTPSLSSLAKTALAVGGILALLKLLRRKRR